MPRPKGSKNKKNAAVIETVGNIDEKIAAAEAAVAELTAELKAKKAELKKLIKEQGKAAERAAAQKAEEDKAKLIEAFAESGKSVEEIIEMMKR